MMAMASADQLHESMDWLDQRLAAFEKRLTRALWLTQTVGISILALIIWFKT